MVFLWFSYGFPMVFPWFSTSIVSSMLSLESSEQPQGALPTFSTSADGRVADLRREMTRTTMAQWVGYPKIHRTLYILSQICKVFQCWFMSFSWQVILGNVSPCGFIIAIDGFFHGFSRVFQLFFPSSIHHHCHHCHHWSIMAIDAQPRWHPGAAACIPWPGRDPAPNATSKSSKSSKRWTRSTSSCRKSPGEMAGMDRLDKDWIRIG